MNWTVPFSDVRLGEDEKAAVMAVLDSNWLTMGPKTLDFEAAFVAALATPGVEAVALTNCTAALHLAMAALGIGPGDEVIVPSLTFVATANAARYVGATPVFTDVVSDDDWTIDPADIARKITSRTKAIIPVHYAGYPCRMAEIMELARRHGLKVVEDASHAPLSTWNGRMLGTIGDVGCFSFFGNKNMTTGEGGMVVASPELVQAMRSMRSHGMTSNTYARYRGHAFGYDVVGLGWNYRMDEMRAAMGVVQLAKLPANNRRRRDLVAYYRRQLAERLPAVGVPFRDVEGEFAYHIFPILLPDGCGDREAVMQGLKDRGVQTSIHYRPIHWLTEFGGGETVSLPVTDKVAPRILTLPLFPTLTSGQIDMVVDALVQCLP